MYHTPICKQCIQQYIIYSLFRHAKFKIKVISTNEAFLKWIKKYLTILYTSVSNYYKVNPIIKQFA